MMSSIRAFVLYHMFPYDKSLWKSLQNPYWLLFTVLGMVPIVGQIWWIILFAMKDKTNEHQLCSFIIGFKASQFITIGVIGTYWGILKYIYCTLHTPMNCIQCKIILSFPI